MEEQVTVAAARELPIEFRATGAEYFRIWIVNLLLTIVTIGIYSAWAKVRRRFDDILCRMIGTSGHKDSQLPPFLATHPAIHDRAHCAGDK